MKQLFNNYMCISFVIRMENSLCDKKKLAMNCKIKPLECVMKILQLTVKNIWNELLNSCN